MGDKPDLSEADIVKLVKLIEKRPEIWDNSCNRDKERRRNAWIAIFYEFYPCWDVIPSDRQKILEETYKGKWKHLREKFLRSARRKQTCDYPDNLKFLLKNSVSRKQSTPIPATQAGPSNEPTSAERKMKRQAGKKLTPEQKRMKTASEQSSEPPEGDARQQLPHPKTTSIPTSSVHSAAESYQDSESVVDGDENGKHFFEFINNGIKDFSEDQKLEFRFPAFSVIVDIKKNSKMSNGSPALLTKCEQGATIYSDSDSDSDSDSE